MNGSTEIVIAIVAFCGGLAKYLNDVVYRRRRFSAWQAIMHAVIACFSGFLFAEFAYSIIPQRNLLLVAAGWGGVGGLRVVTGIMDGYFNQRFNVPPSDKDSGKDGEQKP